MLCVHIFVLLTVTAGNLRVMDGSVEQSSTAVLATLAALAEATAPNNNTCKIYSVHPYPANTTRWPNVGLMLGQRCRQWANISSTLGQRVMFAGYLMKYFCSNHGEQEFFFQFEIIMNVFVFSASFEYLCLF